MSLAVTGTVVGIGAGAASIGSSVGLFGDGGSDGDSGGDGSLSPLFDPAYSDLLNLASVLFGTGTPEGRGQNEIFDFLFDPIPVTPAEKSAARFFGAVDNPKFRGANAPFRKRVDSTISDIERILFPEVENFFDTGGLRTDLQPIIDAEIHRLNTETAPGIASRFGPALNLGTGTGFDQALAQSAEDLGFDLGALQVSADESAAGRLASFLESGTAENILQLPLDIRTGAAVLQGDQGEVFRNRLESARPGGRLLDALGPVTGAIQNTSGFLQELPGPDETTSILSSLSELAPLLLSGLSLASGGSGAGLFDSGTGAIDDASGFTTSEIVGQFGSGSDSFLNQESSDLGFTTLF